MKLMAYLPLAAILAFGPALAQTTPATSADIAAQTKTLHNDAYAYSQAIIAAQKTGDAATGAKLDQLHGDLAAIAAALKAGTVTAPSANAGATTAPASTVNAFPANPGDAPFPSPENSRSIRVGTALNSTIGGAPYLLDDTGSVYQLVPIVDRPATDPQGVFYSMGITRNGKLMRRFDDPTYNYDTAAGVMLLRSGKVYVSILGGQWTKFTDGMGSFYNADLPDIATPVVAGAAPATPAAIVLPPRYATAPGSDASCVLTAAPGQIAATMPRLHDGCTLQLSGSYAEDVPILSMSLKVQLMTAATVVDFANSKLAQGKGGFVCQKDCWIDGPGLIKGAGIKEASAGGTAGIRSAGKGVYIKASGGLRIEDNQNGVSTGDSGGVFELDGVHLKHNGLGDGYTHNIYASDCILLDIKNSTSESAKVGHEVKSRCLKTTIANSQLTGSVAGANNDDSSVLDVPDGGQVELLATTITKQPGAMNHMLIGLGVESGKNGPSSLIMTGGALVGLCDSPIIVGRAGAIMTFSGVANDNKVKVQGATATGL